MEPFIDRIMATVEKYNMIAPGDSIVIGVSGGPDSMCLLHVLRSLAEQYRLKLYAVHLNHCFRGKDADEDAEYVRRTCESWGIPSRIEKVEVHAYAAEAGLSDEEAGREVRYGLFRQVLEQIGGNKIAVAQNMNDQVETVLMRFMRGSGIEGLCGIEPVRGDIIRPLIETDRAAIEGYCEKYGIDPRTDKTNLEPVYMRNKVRLELLPYIKNNFNPNIAASLIRFTNIIKEENDYLEKQSEELFLEAAALGNGKAAISAEKLGKAHPAIRRRLVRLSIEKLLGSLKGFEFKNFESVLELLGKPTGAAVVLPNGLKAYISYDRLVIAKNIEKPDKKCYYRLKYNCANFIAETGATITVERAGAAGELRKDRYTVYIDGAGLQKGLVYRNRQDGDMFSPIGMKGSKKLKDYFIDEKIPREERDSIELLADGCEIIWVIGKRLSEKYKVTSETTDILVINYNRGLCNGK